MKRTRAKVHEVASHAGVSIATVSRVARGVGQVAPETRRRVQDAIEELDYRPSHLGRSLAERRHHALGIVFPGLSGPYYSEVIHGFEAEAVAARQSVLILGTHLLEFADDQVLEMARRVDGLAIFGGTIESTTIDKLRRDRLPIVLLASPPVDGIPTVRVDNVQATIDLTRHLIEDHGYDRMTFLGSPVRSPDVLGRWQGFQGAHKRAGIAPPERPVRIGLDQAAGVIGTARLLDSLDPPRAMVCANDEIALGAYTAAAARGVRIPDDLAVVGWDDIPVARLLAPPLTTVCQPMRELGTRTAEILLRGIDGDADIAIDLVLPTTVAIRSSCGCPLIARPDGEPADRSPRAGGKGGA